MIRAAISRPIAVCMLYVAVALLGVVAWARMPVELLPDTDLPRLRVTSRWRGASPEFAEAYLTSPIESAVQQVRGVERVSSVSEDASGVGMSTVDVEFTRGTRMDFARLELSERLAATAVNLPAAATPPRIEPHIPDEFAKQRRPFLRYTVTGPYTTGVLQTEVDQRVAPGLRELAGVTGVRVLGGPTRLVQIRLNPARALALGVTAQDLQSRIEALEHTGPAGKVRLGRDDHVVSIRGGMRSLEEVARLPVLTDQGRIVRLGDVATVDDGWETPSSLYRVNGAPAITFEVTKEAGTNVVELADRTKSRMSVLRPKLSPGTRVILDDDESEAVRAQLTDLSGRAVMSLIVLLGVLIAFLRSARAAVVVLASVGFSALVTVNMIFLSGLSLNVLTLMGLALGFGLVVDNAVVVVESIYRRLGEGEPLSAAAERGAREMVLPVLAATATTVLALLPFVYLQGEMRLYYVPLGIVVAFTNLASLLVTFTLTPALARRLLSSGTPAGRDVPKWMRMHERLFTATLRASLRRPWTAVVLTALALGGSWYAFDTHVTPGAVWRPWYSDGTSIQISIELPNGEELARADELARKFEARVRSLTNVARVTTRVFPQAAHLEVRFPDAATASVDAAALKEQLESYGRMFGGVVVRVYGFGPSFSGDGGAPPTYTIRVLGYNFERVREIANELATRLRRSPRVQEVDINSSGSSPADHATEVVVRVDRRRLAEHGLSARELVDRVSLAVGGDGARNILTLGDSSVAYAVNLEGHEEADVLELGELVIPTAAGAAVRLSEVAVLDDRATMGRILRENQQYQRTVAYEFRGPGKLGDRMQRELIAGMRLPAGYSLVTKDEWKWDVESRRQIAGVFALSIILIFMVTAALFESIRQPFCVLLTIPLGLIGVFLTFVLTGAEFTREAVIGVIMMGGVVVNNAILLIDHINTLRRVERLQLMPAVLHGTIHRIRPILMTSAMTILGMLPLVLFSAADANIWNAMSYALLGGLSSSTVLVLTVTPAIYLLLERGSDRQAGHVSVTAV